MIEKKYHITTDNQLWNDFLKGDLYAFNIIYKTYIQLLYKYGSNFSHDEALIQDCIHDVFVSLYKYRLNLSETNNIKLYLFKSLKNSIIKSLETKRKQCGLENIEIHFLYEMSSEDKLIENDFEMNRLHQIREALSKLSLRQKEALYLKYNSGLKYEEIGQIMHINYQSARNLVHRSIEKLRESYRNKGILVLFSFLKYNHL